MSGGLSGWRFVVFLVLCASPGLFWLFGVALGAVLRRLDP